MVAGDGRAGRRRRGHRHRAVVRDRAALAGADAELRRGARASVRLGGDLLLPRGDLHRHLPLRLAPARGLGALLERDPGRCHRHRRRRLGHGRERLDELIRAASGSGMDTSSPSTPGGCSSTRPPLRDAAHGARGLHGRRLLVASVYAAGFLRGRRDRYHRLGFAIPFTLGAILLPIQILVGDTAARDIASQQPVKFATMEYVTRTGRDVPESSAASTRTGTSASGSASRTPTRCLSASARHQGHGLHSVAPT